MATITNRRNWQKHTGVVFSYTGEYLSYVKLVTTESRYFSARDCQADRKIEKVRSGERLREANASTASSLAAAAERPAAEALRRWRRVTQTVAASYNLHFVSTSTTYISVSTA